MGAVDNSADENEGRGEDHTAVAVIGAGFELGELEGFI